MTRKWLNHKRIVALVTMFCLMAGLVPVAPFAAPKAAAATFSITEVEYTFGDGVTSQTVTITADPGTNLQNYRVSIPEINYTFPAISQIGNRVTLTLPGSVAVGEKYSLVVSAPDDPNDFVTLVEILDLSKPFDVTNFRDANPANQYPYNVDSTNPGERIIEGNKFQTPAPSSFVIKIDGASDTTPSSFDDSEIRFNVPTPSSNGTKSAYLLANYQDASGGVTRKKTYQYSFGPLNFYPGGTPTPPSIHKVENLFKYSTQPQGNLGTADAGDIYDNTGQQGYLLRITGINFKVGGTNGAIVVYLNGKAYPIVNSNFDDPNAQYVEIRVSGNNLVSSKGFVPVSVGLQNTAGFLETKMDAFTFINDPYSLQIEGSDKVAYVDGGDPVTGNPEKTITIIDNNQSLDRDVYDRAAAGDPFAGSLDDYPAVYFGPFKGTVETASIQKDRIRVKVPQGAVGAYDVRVVSRYGTGVVSGFQYIPRQSAPTLTAIVSADDGSTPVTGTKRDTPVRVYLEGSDFRTGVNGKPPTVYVGDTAIPAANVKYINLNRLEVTMPAWNEPGTFPVTVENPDGGKTPTPVQFTYLSLPAITSADPNKIAAGGGNIVTLQGADLMVGVAVYIGGTSLAGPPFGPVEIPQAEIQRFSSSEVHFRVPSNLGLPVSDDAYIEVLNPDGERFRYTEGFFIRSPLLSPSIDSVIPNRVTKDGGVEVIITGQQFADDARVYIDMTEVDPKDVTWVKDTELRVVIPPASQVYPFDGSNVGVPLTVRVVNEWDASSAAYNDFQYKNTSSSPAITSVAPTAGSVAGGTYVTILGSGFITGTGSGAVADGGDGNSSEVTKVYFGSFEAEAHKVTANSIEVFTPAGALGTVDVRVMNPDGAVALLKNAFTYKIVDSYPHIMDVSPQYGTVNGGTEVTLKASDVRSGVKVYIGGKEATVLNVLPAGETDPNNFNAAVSFIYVRTPAHSAGCKRVSVANPDGGADDFGPKGFCYTLSGSTPTIASVTPATGSTGGGTTVVIKGSDFRSTIRNTTGSDQTYNTILGTITLAPGEVRTIQPAVTFGGVPASQVTLIDDQTVEVAAPVNTAGAKDVTLTNWDFGTATKAKAFTYVPSKPKITSINPSVGKPEGGEWVTLYGEDFQKFLTVTFGNQVVKDNGGDLTDMATENVIVIDSRTILVKTPANTPGTKDVKVTNPDGVTATLAGGFKYATPTSNPVITAISPITGSTEGGQVITITGTDLAGVTQVAVGGKEALLFTVVSATEIRATVPPHTVGWKPVSVQTADAAYTFFNIVEPGNLSNPANKGFYYLEPGSAPRIISVTPAMGPVEGGTAITVSGEGFITTGAGPKVYIGTYEVTVTSATSDKIEGTTPPAAAGLYDVVVVNPDGSTATLEDGFRYGAVPEITAINPDRAPYAGGITATITGKKFAKDSQVTFGSAAAQVIEVSSDGATLIVKVPPGPGDQADAKEAVYVDVTVTNGDGLYGTLVKGFRYLPEGIAPTEPPSVSLRAVNDWTLEASWGTIDFNKGYEIYISKEDNDHYLLLDSVTKERFRDGKVVYLIKGLEPGTRYYVKIRAINDYGFGPFSAEKSAKTKDTGEDPLELNLPGETTTVQGPNGKIQINKAESLKYFYDMTQGDLARAKTFTVSWSGRALGELRGTVVLSAKGVRLDVTPNLLRNVGPLQDTEYANMTFGEGDGQERSKTFRSLKAGDVGGICYVALGSQRGQETKTLQGFRDPLYITMQFEPAKFRGRPVSLYRYDDDNEQWVPVGGHVQGSQITAGVYQKGFYAVMVSR